MSAMPATSAVSTPSVAVDSGQAKRQRRKVPDRRIARVNGIGRPRGRLRHRLDVPSSAGSSALPGSGAVARQACRSRSSRPGFATRGDRSRRRRFRRGRPVRAVASRPSSMARAGVRRRGRVMRPVPRWHLGPRAEAVRDSLVRTWPRRPARQISFSPAARGQPRMDPLCGEAELRWCRAGCDRPLSPTTRRVR